MPQARPEFRADTDIAMKVPTRLMASMVAFYRDTLGLPVSDEKSGTKVEFGPCTLWLDHVPAMTQPELWLKVAAPDTAAAARWLEEKGVLRCDEVERLPEGFDGFWIAAPGGMIHLVAGTNPPAR